MKFGVATIFYIVVIAGLQNMVLGKPAKVSSKLDFDEDETPKNDSMPETTGRGKAKSDEHSVHSTDSPVSSGSSQSGPKIYGVRVTVDTGDTRDRHKSQEHQESGELREKTEKPGKLVIIHTDLTFEIVDMDKNNNTNVPSSSERDDASVPVFKGRSSTNDKSHDDKSRWATSKSRGSPNNGGYYPHYMSTHPDTDDHHDSHYSPRGDGWNSYVPVTRGWTTERYYNDLYKPSPVIRKPCYCISSEIVSRNGRA